VDDPVVAVALLVAAVAALVADLVFVYGLGVREGPGLRRRRQGMYWGGEMNASASRAIPASPVWLVGVLLLTVGRIVAGRTFRFEDIPADVGQDLMALGILVVVLGVLVYVRPPRWLVPPWLAEVNARRAAGLAPFEDEIPGG